MFKSITIESYMIFSAVVVFLLYALFAQGKKKTIVKSGTKPKITPIEVYKTKGNGLSTEELKKLE